MNTVNTPVAQWEQDSSGSWGHM